MYICSCVRHRVFFAWRDCKSETSVSIDFGSRYSCIPVNRVENPICLFVVASTRRNTYSYRLFFYFVSSFYINSTLQYDTTFQILSIFTFSGYLTLSPIYLFIYLSFIEFIFLPWSLVAFQSFTKISHTCSGHIQIRAFKLNINVCRYFYFVYLIHNIPSIIININSF